MLEIREALPSDAEDISRLNHTQMGYDFPPPNFLNVIRRNSNELFRACKIKIFSKKIC